MGDLPHLSQSAAGGEEIGQSTAILPPGCLAVFRLDKTAEGTSIKLILNGQLSGDCIAAIETSCDEAIGNGKGVELVLHDVPSVDEAGRSLLRRLAAKGVRLIGKGVYTSYIVQSLEPTGLRP